jgi:anti-sigma factor RsiW
MKPCSDNRKQLAWLAAGALDETQSRELRAHVETCAGCREYLSEMTVVTHKLAASKITPEIQASEAFHQRVVRSVRAVKPVTVLATLVVAIRGGLLSWRLAVPVAALIVVLGFIEWNGSRQHKGEVVSIPQPVARVVVTPRIENDLPPTFSNYRMAANRSSESFDELLARQARKNLPSAPIYTASTLGGEDGAN